MCKRMVVLKVTDVIGGERKKRERGKGKEREDKGEKINVDKDAKGEREGG